MSMVSLSAWQQAGKYFSHQQHQIFYRDDGQGEALLLIHGFPSASFDWMKTWSALREKYRLIAPDMIGFGFSDKPAGYPYNIHDQADLHVSLMQHLGLTACRVIAHDYGVSVAQELLARQNDGTLPFTIHSIAFLNGGIIPGEHRPRPIQRLLLSPVGFLLTRLLTKKKLRRNFDAIFGPQTKATDNEIDDFWAMNTYNDGQLRMHRLIRYMTDRATHKTRWVGALQKTPIPLCLINGGFDPVSGAHAADRFQELLPQAAVYRMPDIGHYPQVEAPDRVLTHYFTFVDQTS